MVTEQKSYKETVSLFLSSTKYSNTEPPRKHMANSKNFSSHFKLLLMKWLFTIEEW